ncbi:hypothetical protein HMPREF1861_01644 [Corynebacterium kroppenstedtii]|nr:hypothetical protein HMPREF1861_01644 [Corynebacterium kroppenstedtii]
MDPLRLRTQTWWKYCPFGNTNDVVICHGFVLAMNSCWVVFVAGESGSSGVTGGWHPHDKRGLIWLGWGMFLLAVWGAPLSSMASPPDH